MVGLAESRAPNRIMGLIRETREVAVGEKSVQVSERGRQCQTLVSGSRITSQCDFLTVCEAMALRQTDNYFCVCV